MCQARSCKERRARAAAQAAQVQAQKVSNPKVTVRSPVTTTKATANGVRKGSR